MPKPLKNPSLWLTGGLILTLGTCYFFIPPFQSFCDEAFEVLSTGEQEKISDWIKPYGAWGPIILILSMIIQLFLLVVPSVALMTVCILAYGPIWGSAYTLIGVYLSATVAFQIGKFANQTLINRLTSKSTNERLQKIVDRYGAWVVALARVNPILSNDTISIVSGVAKMNYWTFIFATIGGSIPLLALISYLGESPEKLKSGMIWTSVIGVGVAIGYFIYKKIKN